MTPSEFLSKPTTPYSDWFGKGDSHDDYKSVIEGESEPTAVFQEGCMLLIVWPDKFTVTGYDGNEYRHTWTFSP